MILVCVSEICQKFSKSKNKNRKISKANNVRIQESIRRCGFLQRQSLKIMKTLQGDGLATNDYNYYSTSSGRIVADE